MAESLGPPCSAICSRTKRGCCMFTAWARYPSVRSCSLSRTGTRGEGSTEAPGRRNRLVFWSYPLL
jgi:hypothetical protein